MPYPFQQNDGGRSESKRPEQKNDCTVRAVAIATNLPYDEAYDLLMTGGRKSHSRFEFRRWLKTIEHTVNGYRLIWEPYPAVKGQKRMNLIRFSREYSKGRYIVLTAKHVNAVIDGVAHDTGRTYDERCIYGAWKVEKVATRVLTSDSNSYSVTALRARGANMKEIQETITEMKGKRVTIFYIDSMIGLGYRRVEATFNGGEIGEYAQYSNAVRLDFTPKRGKTGRSLWQTSHPSVVIADGWNLPELPGAFTKEERSGAVVTSRSRHSAFSAAWGQEFSSYVKHLAGKVLLDLRGYEIKADRWEKAKAARS